MLQIMAMSANGRSINPWTALIKIASRLKPVENAAGMRQGKSRCRVAAGKRMRSIRAFPADRHISECMESDVILEQRAGRRQKAKQQTAANGIQMRSSSAR